MNMCVCMQCSLTQWWCSLFCSFFFFPLLVLLLLLLAACQLLLSLKKVIVVLQCYYDYVLLCTILYCVLLQQSKEDIEGGKALLQNNCIFLISKGDGKLSHICIIGSTTSHIQIYIQMMMICSLLLLFMEYNYKYS